MSSSRSRLGIWMGVMLTIWKGESCGLRLPPLRGEPSESPCTYSMPRMHQMPPVSILVYSRTYLSGTTKGSILRLASVPT